MSKDKKTLVLLDAHAIIHRAYHALPEFLSSKGEPTGALYGLSTMLMKIIDDLKPDYIIACYDLPDKTFRHEIYDDYKAGRAKTEDALITQLQNSRKIFEAFNIPIYDSPGFEADDVLGTIVAKLKKDKNINIIIASGDMDTMQLVDGKKVQIYTLKKGINDTILYDEEAVRTRFGFKPQFLTDYKGLRGDPSDNIIGIKGIGEKTATILISKFGTIEEIYQQLKINNYELQFKKLGFSDRIIKLLKENEEEALFSKTLATIRTDAKIDFQIPKSTFWENADLAKIEQIFNLFEFRSLFKRLEGFFNKNTPENQNKNPDISFKAMENEKIDENLLQEASIGLWLLNSDINNPQLEDILIFANTKSLAKAHQDIFQQLKDKKLDKVFSEIEKPIMSIVKSMEEYGILIDQEYFYVLSKEYHIELDKLTQKIYSMAGVEFNINSPKQMGEVLFGKMGMKSSKKKNASGSFSTKVAVLEELQEDNPIIKEILAYRELQKLLSTYIDVIPGKTRPDKRLHARFIQNGTTTGRFSSSDPNLQNLPIKTELGRKIRDGFIASRGHKLSAFDYSQIELRVAAILSGDKKMTQIFKDRKDIHAGVASFVFGVPLDQVDAEMRRKAKVINFGIIYGMGVTALRKNLGGTREEAQTFYNNYFNQFSGVRDYLDKVKVFAERNLYVETLFGRRRYFPNIRSRLPFLKNMAERTATNAPIQGTAADIIKLAIRFVSEDLIREKLADKVHLILQIHDELVFEIEEEVLEQANKIIQNAMEQVLFRSYLQQETDIPLLVHFNSGDNLGEIK